MFDLWSGIGQTYSAEALSKEESATTEKPISKTVGLSIGSALVGGLVGLIAGFALGAMR